MLKKRELLLLLLFSFYAAKFLIGCASLLVYDTTIVGRIVDTEGYGIPNLLIVSESGEIAGETIDSGDFKLQGIAYRNSHICINYVYEEQTLLLDCVQVSSSSIDTSENKAFINMGTFILDDSGNIIERIPFHLPQSRQPDYNKEGGAE